MFTPGLWLHEWRPIQFSLVADDFGVKYVGKEHAKHLVDALEEHYEISQDWEGKKILRTYLGMGLQSKKIARIHAGICTRRAPAIQI